MKSVTSKSLCTDTNFIFAMCFEGFQRITLRR